MTESGGVGEKKGGGGGERNKGLGESCQLQPLCVSHLPWRYGDVDDDGPYQCGMQAAQDNLVVD